MEYKPSYWHLHCVKLKINIRSEIYRHLYFKYGHIFSVLKKRYLTCFENGGFNQEIRYQFVMYIHHSSANINSIREKSYRGLLEWLSM